MDSVLCLFFITNGEEICTFKYHTIFLLENFQNEEQRLFDGEVCSCSFYTNMEHFGYNSEVGDEQYNELIIGPQANNWETYERLGRCSAFVYNGFNLNIVNTNFFLWNNNLVQIFLNDSNVRHIQPGAFNGLPHLIELYLQNNNLHNLTDGLFNALTKLKVLLLNNNKINYISDYAFMGLNSLIILSLKSNHITTLSETLLRPVQNLKVLNISSNPLEKIHLNRLFLSQLSLQNLGFTTLKPIDSVLYIGNDNLKLRTQSVNLTLLDLSQNNFEELHDFVFLYTTKLNMLNLSSNAISKISLKSFAALSSVIMLDLSHNYLGFIVQGIFNDLKKLEILDLSYNRIKNIGYGCFEGLLPKLRILNLSYNSIKSFAIYLPVYSSLLEQHGIRLNLYLNNNQLSDLHINSFKYLLSVSLDGNPWSCHKLSELISSLQESQVEIFSGNTINISNIYKIGCNDTLSLNISNNLDLFSKTDQNVSTYIEKLIQTLSAQSDSLFEKSAMKAFFQSGFQNTAFYNFFKHFNNTIKDSVKHEVYFDVSQFQNFSRNSKLYDTTNVRKLVNDEEAENEVAHTILIILYFLTFALYAIICMLIIFSFIFIKRKKILKYNVTKDQLM